MILAAVDPGIDRCGTAVFIDGRLRFVGLIAGKAPTALSDVERAATTARATIDAVCAALGNVAAGPILGAGVLQRLHLVVEWPRVYMPGKSKGGARDLLVLACVDGALCALAMSRGAQVSSTTPEGWKGQMPDVVVRGRVIDRLDVAERVVLSTALDGIAKGLQHNATDAVGIGLHALKRFGASLGDSGASNLPGDPVR